MEIPPWLAALTGAYGQQAASGLGAMGSGNATAPSMMDAARGIGHDMMEHFRAGQPASRSPLATPGAATAPDMTTVAPPVAAPAAPPIAAPAPINFTPGAGPPDLATILHGVGGGIAPHLPQGVPLSKIQLHFATPDGMS